MQLAKNAGNTVQSLFLLLFAAMKDVQGEVHESFFSRMHGDLDSLAVLSLSRYITGLYTRFSLNRLE